MGDVKVIHCFVLKKGQYVQTNQHEAFWGKGTLFVNLELK